jgi:hypothetical protein
MSEAASEDGRGRESAAERAESERRRTIDLVRAERGEPERRRLPKFPDPRGHTDETPPDAVS